MVKTCKDQCLFQQPYASCVFTLFLLRRTWAPLRRATIYSQYPLVKATHWDMVSQAHNSNSGLKIPRKYSPKFSVDQLSEETSGQEISTHLPSSAVCMCVCVCVTEGVAKMSDGVSESALWSRGQRNLENGEVKSHQLWSSLIQIEWAKY